MAKLVKEERVISSDTNTGEVLSDKTSTTVIEFPKEPSYVKLYIEDLCLLKGLNNPDQALLRLLLIRLDYDGYVTLSSRSREAIANTLGVTTKTLRNRLNRLVKSTLIKPTAQNEYMVNPNYFAKGSWKSVCDQRKKFQLVLSYSDKGREERFTTES